MLDFSFITFGLDRRRKHRRHHQEDQWKEFFPSEDVKLALAARPAGLATPASASSSSLPEESETPSSSTTPVTTNTSLPPSVVAADTRASTTIISISSRHQQHHNHLLQQQQIHHPQQQSNPSPAYTTYSNASTATTFTAEFPSIVEQAVLVPFEGGCMAREHYWPTGSKTAQDQEKRALAAEHDRQVRNRSVANDIRLDLPVSVARPDGEARQRLRSHDKRNEIQKPYIQGPPNKTVWDSRDCFERTVTQPSSSSSSRSGGSKSTSKSSSSHWGLSWSRSNKSPPSQGRNSRGQQRLNPSTSVRNAPSSCETARGNSGGGGAAGNGGLLAGPSLHSSFMPSSSSTLDSIANSSLIGFHGAASIAGDNSAFPNHNQSSFSSHQSTPVITSCKQPQHHHQQQHHQPVVFPGGGGITPSPSIAERLSEKVQQCTNVIVGNHTRTSPNNNGGGSSTQHHQAPNNTSVLSRLIDPDSKLFSRNSSKESKRSNNNNNHGKNGKSHRTDQSSSASSSPGGSSSSLVEGGGAQASGTIFPQHHHQGLQQHEQLQQQQNQFNYFQQSTRNSQQSQSVSIPHHLHHHHPQQFMSMGMHEGSSSSSLSSCSVPTTNPFLTSFETSRDGDEGMIIKRSNNNVVIPLLRSQTPDNNNPNCSLSGGSRTSSGRSGPRSFDAYCGADAGANLHNTCSSDSKAGGVMSTNVTDPIRFHDPSSLIQLREQGSPLSSSISAMSDCENGNKCSSSRNKNSTDESNGRVPPVAATVQSLTSQQHCGASDTNTLKLSQSSFPHPTRTGGSDDANSILDVMDEEMKGLETERMQQQQQQKLCPDAHSLLLPSSSTRATTTTTSISSNVSFSQQNVQQLTSSVANNPSFLPPSYNFNSAAASLPRESVPPLPPSSSPHTALATASFSTAAVAESELPSVSSCSGKEKKRRGTTFSSSGCSTDPNYSTFDNDKVITDNDCCTPPSISPPHPFSSSRENKSHLQSQHERNNEESRMIVSDNNNFNTDCSSSSSHRQQQQQHHHHHHRPSDFTVVADHGDEQMISESTVSCATTVITNANNVKDVEESGESMTCRNPFSSAVRETAHHHELSVIASKNDTTTNFDQYCKVAAASTAELITSLHSSPSTNINNNNNNSTASTATSSSALSLPPPPSSSSTTTTTLLTSSNLPLMSSSSPVASHHHHHQQQEQRHHQNVVVDDKFDYDMQNQ